MSRDEDKEDNDIDIFQTVLSLSYDLLTKLMKTNEFFGKVAICKRS